MPNKKQLKLLEQSLALFTASHLSRTVYSETSSFLEQATVIIPSFGSLVPSWTSAKENLIDCTFKSLVTVEPLTAITDYPDDSVWYMIDLITSQTVETALIVNNAAAFDSQRMFGTSYLCVGNNSAGPKATGNSCTAPFYDGGFITARLTGRYVFLYREGFSYYTDYYAINEVRLYGMHNRVGSATVISSYTPIEVSNKTYGPKNLVTNLNNRSHIWNAPPLTDASGNVATQSSCFRVDTKTVSSPFIFGLDHGFEIIQNAVLLVLDQLSGVIGSESTDDLNKYYTHSWEVYIGNSPDYSQNPKCPGGPLLKGTFDEYFDEGANKGFQQSASPAFGFEKWCNMSGQYTFFVSTGVPTEELSLCSIGVFGTIYIRKELITTTFNILTDTQSVIKVPHVFAEDFIGDKLAIDLRQKVGSELPFIQFRNQIDFTDVLINAVGVKPGSYNLVLESFDTNSALQTLTLKTDKITIFVDPIDVSETKAFFVSKPLTQSITSGYFKEWQLPEIEAYAEDLQVRIQSDPVLKDQISIDSNYRTISFRGDQIKEIRSPKTVQITITLVSKAGENVYTQNVYILPSLESVPDESKKDDNSLKPPTEPSESTDEEGKTDSETNAGGSTTTSQDTSTGSSTTDQTAQDQTQKDAEKYTQITSLSNLKKTVTDPSAFGDQYAKLLLNRDLVKKNTTQAATDLNGGPMPPEIRVSEISNTGKVTLFFTNQMKFPPDLQEILVAKKTDASSSSQVKGDKKMRILSAKIKLPAPLKPEKKLTRDDYIQVMIFDPETDGISENLASWTIISFDSSSMVIQLEITRPLLVSQGQKPNLLLTEMRFSSFKDIHGNSLPEIVLKIENMPRQISSAAEAEAIQEAGTTSTVATAVAMGLNGLLNASLSQLYQFLNVLQIIVHTPMFEGLMFPANASMLNDAFIQISNFKLIDSWDLVDLKFLFFFPEDEALNINFKACGYDSTLLLPNASLTIWIIYFNCGLAVVWLLLKVISRFTNRLSCIIEKLQTYLFWNGPIRLFMELYFEVAFASSLNLYVVDWDTPYPAVQYSNILALILFVTCAAVTLFLIIFYAINLNRLNEETFRDRYGGGVEDSNLDRAKDRWSIIVILASFFGRRIAFIASVIFLGFFLWAQLAIQIMISVFMIILLLTYWPLQSHFAVRIEVMNECTVLLFIYCMMCFTDFVPDPETRSYVGYFYMGFISANVLVHLIFLVLETFRKLRKDCRGCYSKYIAKKNKTKHPRPVDVANARLNDAENPIPVEAANSNLVKGEKVAQNSVMAKEPLQNISEASYESYDSSEDSSHESDSDNKIPYEIVPIQASTQKNLEDLDCSCYEKHRQPDYSMQESIKYVKHKPAVMSPIMQRRNSFESLEQAIAEHNANYSEEHNKQKLQSTSSQETEKTKQRAGKKAENMSASSKQTPSKSVERVPVKQDSISEEFQRIITGNPDEAETQRGLIASPKTTAVKLVESETDQRADEIERKGKENELIEKTIREVLERNDSKYKHDSLDENQDCQLIAELLLVDRRAPQKEKISSIFPPTKGDLIQPNVVVSKMKTSIAALRNKQRSQIPQRANSCPPQTQLAHEKITNCGQDHPEGSMVNMNKKETWKRAGIPSWRP